MLCVDWTGFISDTWKRRFGFYKAGKNCQKPLGDARGHYDTGGGFLNSPSPQPLRAFMALAGLETRKISRPLRLEGEVAQ